MVHPRRGQRPRWPEHYDAVVLDIELGRERHAGVALINAINKLRQGTPVLVVSAMPTAIYHPS